MLCQALRANPCTAMPTPCSLPWNSTALQKLNPHDFFEKTGAMGHSAVDIKVGLVCQRQQGLSLLEATGSLSAAV